MRGADLRQAHGRSAIPSIIESHIDTMDDVAMIAIIDELHQALR